VSGIARRLDRDRAPLEARRQCTFGNKFVEHSVEERGILGVKAHIPFSFDKARRAALAQQSRAVTSGGGSQDPFRSFAAAIRDNSRSNLIIDSGVVEK
jgi:hypothetical protein